DRIHGVIEVHNAGDSGAPLSVGFGKNVEVVQILMRYPEREFSNAWRHLIKTTQGLLNEALLPSIGDCVHGFAYRVTAARHHPVVFIAATISLPEWLQPLHNLSGHLTNLVASPRRYCSQR